MKTQKLASGDNTKIEENPDLKYFQITILSSEQRLEDNVKDNIDKALHLKKHSLKEQHQGRIFIITFNKPCGEDTFSLLQALKSYFQKEFVFVSEINPIYHYHG